MGGDSLDHHHAFVVQYKDGEDLHLEMHVDDAEVTLNLCLVDDFEGCGLVFCGVKGEQEYLKYSHAYKHRRGTAVIHAGRHRHGADHLESGERYNLIVWCRSSSFRSRPDFESVNTAQHRDELKADQVCVSISKRK